MKAAGRLVDDPVLREAMRLPPAGDRQVIGLFGGSFNPPHEGHVHVSEVALKRAGLDQVWWLVTPGNPLKDHGELAPLGERVRMARSMITHPRIRVTAFEAAHGLSYTAETLAVIRRMRPRLEFVWIMGADNLAGFHRWQDWQAIAASVPIVVVDRPGSTLSFLSARAAIRLARHRIDESDASLIGRVKPPAWTFIHAPRIALSSTAIRNAANSADRASWEN